MQSFLQLHESPGLFRQALNFTEAETGFARRLIEKDYFCSLVLADFESLFDLGLVFKGGTSLSKYHAGFYRLSEDLDFAFAASINARRSDRRKIVAPVKQHLEHVTLRLPGVSLTEPLRGHDDGRQYNTILTYESSVTGEREVLKIQVAIREPFIDSPVSCLGRTLLCHPFPNITESSVKLCVLSLRETYAEKVRTALTRSPPAIRDIYDIDDALLTERVDFLDSEFLELVRKKLAVPRNSQVEIGAKWKTELRKQLETDLKPVLRGTDYARFEIERAFVNVDDIVSMLSKSTS
jgi:predicted nucleotidyltransferase component of viral defense system